MRVSAHVPCADVPGSSTQPARACWQSPGGDVSSTREVGDWGHLWGLSHGQVSVFFAPNRLGLVSKPQPPGPPCTLHRPQPLLMLLGLVSDSPGGIILSQ